MTHPISQVKKVQDWTRWRETLREMTEQLAAIKVNRVSPCTKHCFKCGKPGHRASNCHSRSEPTCYNCGKREHVFQNCWSQGNSQGVSQIFKLGHSQELINARPIAYIPTLAHSNYTAYTHGQLNKNSVTILLDSEASCSVLSKDHVSPSNIKPVAHTKLVNAEKHHTLWHSHFDCNTGTISTEHSFIVVDHLSVPSILECDFLREHGFVVNFESGTYYRADCPNQALPLQVTELQSFNAITIDKDCPQAIPVKCDDTDQIQLEMPTDVHPELRTVVQEFKELSSKQLGQTNVKKHIIDTGEATSIKVPPRQIPFHYPDQVHAQLQDMAFEGIIHLNTSPWCAPAVYVTKSSGEVRI